MDRIRSTCSLWVTSLILFCITLNIQCILESLKFILFWYDCYHGEMSKQILFEFTCNPYLHIATLVFWSITGLWCCLGSRRIALLSPKVVILVILLSLNCAVDNIHLIKLSTYIAGAAVQLPGYVRLYQMFQFDPWTVVELGVLLLWPILLGTIICSFGVQENEVNEKF